MNSYFGKAVKGSTRAILASIVFVSFGLFVQGCGGGTTGVLSCSASAAGVGTVSTIATSATVDIMYGNGPFTVSLPGASCIESSTSIYTCTGTIQTGTAATVFDTSNNQSTTCAINSGVSTYSSTIPTECELNGQIIAATNGVCPAGYTPIYSGTSTTECELNGQIIASTNGVCPAGYTPISTGASTSECELNGQTFTITSGYCPTGTVTISTGTTGIGITECELNGQTFTISSGVCPTGSITLSSGTTGFGTTECEYNNQTFTITSGVCPTGSITLSSGTTGIGITECELNGQTFSITSGVCPTGSITLSTGTSGNYCTLNVLSSAGMEASFSVTAANGQPVYSISSVTDTVNGGYPTPVAVPSNATTFQLGFNTAGVNTLTVQASTATGICTATASVNIVGTIY